jgi:hypothetical protein
MDDKDARYGEPTSDTAIIVFIIAVLFVVACICIVVLMRTFGQAGPGAYP